MNFYGVKSWFIYIIVPNYFVSFSEISQSNIKNLNYRITKGIVMLVKKSGLLNFINFINKIEIVSTL